MKFTFKPINKPHLQAIQVTKNGKIWIVEAEPKEGALELFYSGYSCKVAIMKVGEFMVLGADYEVEINQ